MKLKRMIGRLEEQMRRGHSDAPVIIADGRHATREVQDVRVVLDSNGIATHIELFTEVRPEYVRQPVAQRARWLKKREPTE